MGTSDPATFDVEVHVEQLAVNFDQIGRWSLPTRDVKMSDSRAPEFVRQYGPISCELDAIPPKRLRSLVSEAIRKLEMIEAAERDGIVEMFAGR